MAQTTERQYKEGYPRRCDACRQMQNSPKSMKHHRCSGPIRPANMNGHHKGPSPQQ